VGFSVAVQWISSYSGVRAAMGISQETRTGTWRPKVKFGNAQGIGSSRVRLVVAEDWAVPGALNVKGL